jgi:formylmethanofuran dehydrogenase subunit E-like metal-binding protein
MNFVAESRFGISKFGIPIEIRSLMSVKKNPPWVKHDTFLQRWHRRPWTDRAMYMSLPKENFWEFDTSGFLGIT